MWHGETIMAILVLGFVGTAIAYLLFFELIQRAGANYATLVTYLVPPIALAYGAIFLGERFGATAFGGARADPRRRRARDRLGSARVVPRRSSRGARGARSRLTVQEVYAAAVACSSATGSSKAKMLPCRGAGSTQIRPCMEATSWRQM